MSAGPYGPGALSATFPHYLWGSLRAGFFMFWQTLWPLVLGFGISGAVRALVPPSKMQRSLGNHGARALLRATGFGMISSSCSYAAATVSKSLFQKGADFVAAIVFMFASTNLVIELGILLMVLLGWRFAAAEFLGGPVMILLFVAGAGLVLRPALVEGARHRLFATRSRSASASSQHHVHEVPDRREPGFSTKTLLARLTSKPAWMDASAYAVSDAKMLRRELLIGYGIGGVLIFVVPEPFWSSVFFHGHGLWTVLENTAIAPLVALMSFVCSIGNVPLAAALWRQGIDFGGVISFLFADLITLPLLLVYRRYYGTRVALRLLALFWITMSGAGLAVDALFTATGLKPSSRPTHIATQALHWNYTTYLNFLFVALALVAYFLQRKRPAPDSCDVSEDSSAPCEPVLEESR